MDNWDTLMRMYKDRGKAFDRMGTMMSDTGFKYADQYGDTTYTWDLDWLSRDNQCQVRKTKELIEQSDLTNSETYTAWRGSIRQGYTTKQRRFLNSWLFTQRTQQQWSLVEESTFVVALKNRLSKVTPATYHDVYGTIAGILLTNEKLNFSEKAYGWALIHSLRDEFHEDAIIAMINHEDETYAKWKEGLKTISFRHMTIINHRVSLLKTSPHVMFLIKEAVKQRYANLAKMARTTQFIQDCELYLTNVQDGLAELEVARVEDILAASKMAKSAAHLAGMVDQLSSK